MPSRRRFLATSVSLPAWARAQGAPQYRIDTDHPRLLLPQRRARLIRREQERDTMRWAQFKTLVEGGAAFPEPGFALATYYMASGNQERGRQAVEWALGPGADLRQLAIVFDWCQILMSKEESAKLEAKLRAALAATSTSPATGTPAAHRTRLFAAIALAGHGADVLPGVVEDIYGRWWERTVTPRLKSGELVYDPRDHFALYELFHAMRDNFDLDLRENAPHYFATLPVFHLLAHYPAPYPGPENEYRIPVMKAHAEPDLRVAALSRAAALAMVAFDTNAQESQFLQGWLIQDRFLMRGPFAIPYEFLWANPYQPGLSYHYLPNVFHDAVNGRLLVRSSWEDDATWFYQSGGMRQMFHDGQVINLDQAALDKPLVMGNTTLLTLPATGRFAIEAGQEKAHYYLFGLKPKVSYDVEIDDEEMTTAESGQGGVIELAVPPRRRAGVRVRRSGTLH
ncbi:MAG: hypothetical protein IT164_16540 [Bryobacterales bacterium]|nr:hypothetical protein [Bryobacterales bacterium]